MNTSDKPLLEDFQEYFDIEIASSPKKLAEVYQIRYRVYCEEFKYEPIDTFKDGQEVDEFDETSVHCLVTHKASGLPAGCVRLVMVNDTTQMPMEKFCRDSLDTDLMAKLAPDRPAICEFSRLAVDGAFRRRAGEHASRFGEITALDCTLRERRTFSLIAVSTFIAAFAVSDLIGRPNCFAMMEPFLPRLLKRSGIVVQRVGEDADYHGTRGPYFITAQDAVNGMPQDLKDFYNTIHGKFSPVLGAGGQSVIKREVSVDSEPFRAPWWPQLRTV